MEKGEVQVFVDDFVLGRLPPVCVVTGQATNDQVKMRSNVHPLNPVWLLLILLGPIGWLILLAVAWSNGDYLTGWLPYSRAEMSVRDARRRLLLIGTAVAVVGFLLLAGFLHVPVMFGGALVALFAGLIGFTALESREPRVSLDASGRWVTIRRVHPSFVASVSARSGDRERPSLRP